ncbi:hypothetical protein NXF25_019935 [Crotalus adamanteus]|uniref:Uncharacterized protein n=1 Tax=Crotalus adamanteus TaxID=8729 RepID=A0AAW1B399_CROAD
MKRALRTLTFYYNETKHKWKIYSYELENKCFKYLGIVFQAPRKLTVPNKLFYLYCPKRHTSNN